MKKSILFLIAVFAYSLSANAQWLYRVKRDSLTHYVVATHSLVNPLGVVSQIEGLTEAMTHTKGLVLDVQRLANSTLLTEARRLPTGKSLASLLTPEQLGLLDGFLKKYTEVGWKSPYNQRRYNDKVPAAVREELEKLLFVANHMGEYDPTHSFEEYFVAQANKNGDPVRAVEPVDSFIKTTYQAPLKEQTKALTDLLENEAAVLAVIDGTVEAFLSGDLEGVARLSAHSLVRKRAAAWWPHLQTFMHQPTLFALPCEALGGADGLLAKLKEAGYSVEPVQ